MLSSSLSPPYHALLLFPQLPPFMIIRTLVAFGSVIADIDSSTLMIMMMLPARCVVRIQAPSSEQQPSQPCQVSKGIGSGEIPVSGHTGGTCHSVTVHVGVVTLR